MSVRKPLWILIAFFTLFALSSPFAEALSISNVRVHSVASTSITIKWETDLPSTSRVNFGTSLSSLSLSQIDSSQKTSHTIILSSLAQDTPYYFEVISQTLSGDSASDDNLGAKYEARTKDATAPAKIANVTSRMQSLTSYQLEWQSAAESDLLHYVVYRNNAAYQNTTQNTFLLDNLTFGNTYQIRISAIDTSSNEGQKSDALSISIPRPDSLTPLITQLAVVNITDDSAVIVWNTNEDATSKISLIAPSIEVVGPASRLHSLTLTPLRRAEIYNVSVQSCDMFGNCANSSIEFTAGRDLIAPILNLTLPRYTNKRSLTLVGSTEPLSQVELFINDMNIPKRILSAQETGSRGIIQFKNILLADSNYVKVIAYDLGGNSASIEGYIDVDTLEPIVSFRDLSNITSKRNATIAGRVSEETTIRVYALTPKDKEEAPTNVSGFRNASIGNGFIALTWNEVRDKDFSHYILRRGQTPIAIINPASYNFYTDILVDGGQQYSYTISYVNIFGTEGPRSGPLTIRAQGPFLGVDAIAVDAFAEFRKPLLEANISGDFSLALPLSQGDGSYRLKIEVIDNAGNKVIREQHITLDTKAPELRITSPPNGGLVYENYANNIDIEGETDPFARVHLFVGRTPFNNRNLTFDIAGLKREIQDLPESSLDADCTAVIRTSNICSTNADKTVIADAEGRFTFEDVDIRSGFAFAGSITEVSERDFSDTTISRESKRARLVVISTDQAGLRNAAEFGFNVGTCWSGNTSFEVIPLTEYQGPALLSTERLSENTQSIQFAFNYTYIGSGSNAKLTDVKILSACTPIEMKDPRFNLSCKMLPGNIPTIASKDTTVSTSRVQLNRMPGMDTWLELDWNGFFKAINKEVVFPLRIQIQYTHYVNGKKQTATQTTCQEVAYVIDNSRIDPRKVLPDFLLYDFANLLNNTFIPAVNSMQKQVDRALKIVTPICLGTYAVSLPVSMYRRITEKSVELQVNAPLTALSAAYSFTGVANPVYCANLVSAIKANHNGVFKLSYLSDEDLKSCFPQVDSLWGSEESMYKAYRYSCDRIFGHTSPALWTEKKTEEELVQKFQRGAECEKSEQVRGQGLLKVKCEKARPGYRVGDYQFSPDDECVELSFTDGTQRGRSLFLIEGVENSDYGIYTISNTDQRFTVTERFALKVNDKNYLTAQQKSCADVCKGTSGTPVMTLERPANGAYSFTSVAQRRGQTTMDAGVCTTTRNCMDLNAQSLQNPQSGSAGERQALPVFVDGKEVPVKRADPMGYTSDCFYKANIDLDDPRVVSDAPEDQHQCCCLRTSTDVPNKYYTSIDTYYAPITPIPSNNPVHKTVSGSAQNTGEFQAIDWSYRYWKIGFKAQEGTNSAIIHQAYHPNRYVEDRDHPACFGQNGWLQGENLLVLDPARQHLSSLQCVHLGGIRDRLVFLSNIMNAMQNCLVTIRTTGKADAGVCKELFSQYFCSFAWDVIQGFRNDLNGCDSSVSTGIGVDDPDSFITQIQNGLTGVTSTLADKQSEFLGEYQNAKLNELFGVGEDAVARKLCLAALGYDWEITAKSLLEASYAQTVASFVQPVTLTREFQFVDPQTGQSEIEYRGSWLINPGCDLSSYDVKLACIGRDALNSQGNALGIPGQIASNGADCTVQGSKDGVNCPCLDSGQKERGFFNSGTRFSKNQLIDQDHHEVIKDRYRYDHVKITLRPDARIGNNSLRSNCFPSGFDSGVFYFPITDRTPHDIQNCRIDVTSGIYSCSNGIDFFSRKGIGYFADIKINGYDASETTELMTGQSLEIEANVIKSGVDKCIRVFDKRSQTRNVYRVAPVFSDSYTYTDTISSDLSIDTGSSRITTPTGATAELIGTQTNQRSFSLSFFADDTNDDGVLSSLKVDGQDVALPSPPSASSTVPINDRLTVQFNSGTFDVVIRTPEATVGLDLNFNAVANNREDKRFIDGRITVPGISSAESQRIMELEIGLFNLKEGVESFESEADCNFNDPAVGPDGEKQRKSFVIQLYSTTSSNSNSAVRVSANPQAANPNDDVLLKATVRKANSNVEIQTPQLTIAASGEQPFSAPMQLFNDATLTSEYEYSLNAESLPVAGNYNVSVKVGSIVPQEGSRTLEREDVGKTTFSLRCAQNAQCRPIRQNSNCQTAPAQKPCANGQECCLNP